ncbi:DNA methyltransferase [Lactiplantibacillus plantarum]|uniref:DNA methyltransferase n=1 Tax=Lactiplantibacillus plantarum TaxID=1590 RepID=UPI002F2611F0
MIDSKIMETTKSILKEFGNTYFSDKGTLKRNKVIEDLDAYTPMLMKALLADQLIHDTYTESIVIDDKSVELFKLNQFIEMFTYKEYWQDSYTKFENKIGLTAGGKFIDETADVVLDFPFKDTVLKAGMTKEDQKEADEPFLHETIAKAEIDQLLEPKIVVNATKYDQDHLDGESIANLEDDNLIIKGNNLIALYSIKERYAGKIKLIYIDVPFGTGHDSFLYNDKYSRSAWLTFMRNRIEVAKDLLAENGSVFVHLDENQSHYLKVLLDNLFGEENFMNEIIWRYRTYIGQVKDYFPKKHDTIFWYKKEVRPAFTQSNVGNYEDTPDYKRWKSFLDEDGQIRFGNHPTTDSRFQSYLKKYIKQFGEPKEGDIIYRNFGYVVDDVWEDIIALDAKNKSERLDLFSGSGQKPEALLERIISSVTQQGDIVLDFFMGSATTQAVAMKMKRRFIGIEQMDYIKTVSVERLKKVIAGEQGGISKDVNWQGGGSFVYAELMEKNQGYLKDVQQAETTKQLEDVVNRMIAGGADFDFRVDVEKVMQDPEYQAMSLADKKQLMVKVIDKNQLYYAYSDMEDRDVQELMSESDIAFNKSFYGERDL